MKMFKRFAAALLAGVMVLAMLTACGDSPLEEGAFRLPVRCNEPPPFGGGGIAQR